MYEQGDERRPASSHSREHHCDTVGDGSYGRPSLSDWRGSNPDRSTRYPFDHLQANQAGVTVAPTHRHGHDTQARSSRGQQHRHAVRAKDYPHVRTRLEPQRLGEPRQLSAGQDDVVSTQGRWCRRTAAAFDVGRGRKQRDRKPGDAPHAQRLVADRRGSNRNVRITTQQVDRSVARE